MNIVFVATSVLFFSWVIRNIIFLVGLWQLKEYRFDRVFVHLRETRQGRSLLISPISLAKWFFIFGYILVVFNESLLPFYHLGIFLLYFFEAAVVVKENLSNSLKQPEYTPKALFIILMSLCIVFLLYAFPIVDEFLWFLLIDALTPCVVALIVFGLSFPTEVHRDLTVQRAIDTIRKHKRLLVIGVTGSYGKSSTKDYISQILSEKYNVIHTKGTNNTPIGIATTILTELTEKTEIFVVEMGAYRRGEILSMCNIVRPKVGVLTAVNDQHLSLFGSLENTKRAKYELIESLPHDGLGLFNGNNSIVRQLYNKTKKRKVLYQTEYSLHPTEKDGVKPHVIASAIRVKKTSVEFSVTIAEKQLHLEAPLIGGHTIENMLPGIFLGYHLGMSDKKIKHAVANLKPLSKTMIYHRLANGLTVIDDTFNANPEAVLAAIEYAKIYKGKKMLVLQPLIELGKKSKAEHFRIAKTVGSVCDMVILTNHNFYDAIQAGIAESGGRCVVKVAQAAEAGAILKDTATKGDIIVFEGKEAAFVIDKLL